MLKGDTELNTTEQIKLIELQNHLEAVLDTIAGNHWWKDKNGVYRGGNNIFAKNLGIACSKSIIGKTDFELPWAAQAEELVAHDQIVMTTGQVHTFEENAMDNMGIVRTFLVTKAPLRDATGEIIGTMGTSVDITEKKAAEIIRQKTTDAIISDKDTSLVALRNHLDSLLDVIPGNHWWKDKEGRYLGCNENVAQVLKLQSRAEVIGKTDFELPWAEQAQDLIAHDQIVMTAGQMQIHEENVRDNKGQMRTFIVTKAPLRNAANEVIGTVGTSIDITEQKEAQAREKAAREEAEQLRAESAAQQMQLQAQEKFTQAANQVAHDIRSPLTSLLVMVKSCTELPENERIALREAATRIGDIANNLLSQCTPKGAEQVVATGSAEAVLLSATVLQLLTEKKIEYQEVAVIFKHEFSQASQFAFINVVPSDFKRMLSNLINNSIDAVQAANDAASLAEKKIAKAVKRWFTNLIESEPASTRPKARKITVNLDAADEWVSVTVKDEGNGMSSELITKILQKIAVTAGKADGHGIGFTQVQEALARSGGKLAIESHLGAGTQITLTFPRMPAPAWIAETITLQQNDVVVILDDDESIHKAWDLRFDPVARPTKDVKVEHFTRGEETLDFFDKLAIDQLVQKDKIFLLTDFELLKQDLDGLDVIQKSGVKRAILVTSHYTNAKVRQRAAELGIQILPKQLASEIPIYLNKELAGAGSKSSMTQVTRTVDFVYVEDDERLADVLMKFQFKHKVVDYYESPDRLLENIEKYPKSMKFLFDNTYHNSSMTGIDLAKELYKLGYTRLYLLTGGLFPGDKVPDFLKVIIKSNMEELDRVVE